MYRLRSKLTALSEETGLRVIDLPAGSTLVVVGGVQPSGLVEIDAGGMRFLVFWNDLLKVAEEKDEADHNRRGAAGAR